MIQKTEQFKRAGKLLIIRCSTGNELIEEFFPKKYKFRGN